MKKFWLFFFPLIFFFPFCPGPAEATIYKYVDKKGTVHYTDRYESIPQEYRNKIKIMKEEKKDTTSAQKPSSPEDKRREERPSAEEPIGKMPLAARDKAEASEQETSRIQADQQKLKLEEEKEKRILELELQEQIAAKQQEAASLPTNWMVKDRNTLNRINQDISNLERDIQSVREGEGSPHPPQ
jgi:hypothetical protein